MNNRFRYRYYLTDHAIDNMRTRGPVECMNQSNDQIRSMLDDLLVRAFTTSPNLRIPISGCSVTEAFFLKMTGKDGVESYLLMECVIRGGGPEWCAKTVYTARMFADYSDGRYRADHQEDEARRRMITYVDVTGESKSLRCRDDNTADCVTALVRAGVQMGTIAVWAKVPTAMTVTVAETTTEKSCPKG